MDSKEWQVNFFDFLRRELNNPPDFAQRVARTMGCSIPNAYKRISGSSNIKLVELIDIAKEYNLSIDQWLNLDKGKDFKFKSSGFIRTENDFINYTRTTFLSLEKFEHIPHQFYYGARDLPLFFYLLDDQLTRFKLAIWLDGFGRKKLPNGRLNFEFSDELIDNCKKLGKLYLDLDTKEVWTIRTFINLVKQIEVSAFLKQLNQDTGRELIDRLEEQIATVLQFAIRGRKRRGKFELLQSDYLMMTNNALLMAGHVQLAFTSYAGVNYFSSMDPSYTANIKDWFELSFRHATALDRKNPTDVEHYRKVLLDRCALARERIRTANPDVLAD